MRNAVTIKRVGCSQTSLTRFVCSSQAHPITQRLHILDFSLDFECFLRLGGGVGGVYARYKIFLLPLLHSSVAALSCLHGRAVPYLFTPGVRNKATRVSTQAAPGQNDFILDTKQEVKMKTSGGQDQVSVQDEGEWEG